MSPFRTSLHIAFNRSMESTGSFPGRTQVDKLMKRRPWLTCPTTNHEVGATYEYQGQRVSLEWQSAQARVSIACTSDGVAIIVSIVWPGENAGLVCAGYLHCMATKPAASRTATHLSFIPFRTSTNRPCRRRSENSCWYRRIRLTILAPFPGCSKGTVKRRSELRKAFHEVRCHPFVYVLDPYR